MAVAPHQFGAAPSQGPDDDRRPAERCRRSAPRQCGAIAARSGLRSARRRRRTDPHHHSFGMRNHTIGRGAVAPHDSGAAPSQLRPLRRRHPDHPRCSAPARCGTLAARPGPQKSGMSASLRTVSVRHHRSCDGLEAWYRSSASLRTCPVQHHRSVEELIQLKPALSESLRTSLVRHHRRLNFTLIGLLIKQSLRIVPVRHHRSADHALIGPDASARSLRPFLMRQHRNGMICLAGTCWGPRVVHHPP